MQENDTIETDSWAENFAQLLKQKPRKTYFLQGKWGSGKTEYLKGEMYKMKGKDKILKQLYEIVGYIMKIKISNKYEFNEAKSTMSSIELLELLVIVENTFVVTIPDDKIQEFSHYNADEMVEKINELKS